MCAGRNDIPADWYRHAFDDLYPVVYAHRTPESASPEVAFAARVLGLAPGERVLDLACGNGRHMIHLAAMGFKVVGLDYSRDLLTLARNALHSHAGLVRGDMRCLPFSSVFDVVTNFFTSFGYFLDDRDNLLTVLAVADALKPGGRFFIDYANRQYVETTLVPRSSRRSGDYEIAEERWIDRAKHRVNKITTVFRDGRQLARSEESVRLYSLDELKVLLERGGLHADDIYGDFEGANYDTTSPRLIVVGHKEPRCG